jgi:hypothetical protein
VGKVVRIGSKVDSEEARKEARTRAWLMFEVLPVLAPKASVAEKRRLTNEILLLVSGKGRVRLTPTLLSELISIHSQCVLDQVGRCSLTIFVQPLVWELHKALGIADETDAAFKRHDETTAAKPVKEEHFDHE